MSRSRGANRMAWLSLVILSAGACTRSARPGSESPATAAIDFELPRYGSNETFRLSQARGQVVVIDVWATWCVPCREGLRIYEQLSERHRDRGVLFIGLNVDDEPSPIAAFLRQTKVSFPIVLDRGAEIAQSLLKVQVVPTTFVLDKAGAIRHTHEGFNPDVGATLAAQVEKLVQEPTSTRGVP